MLLTKNPAGFVLEWGIWKTYPLRAPWPFKPMSVNFVKIDHTHTGMFLNMPFSFPFKEA
jgi:hypothetical protein